jgi:type II secretory ATPase GspE/PulE/Tfp pilus assembly ATPase PilB-like protein
MDADVMMIGEIRDRESLTAAIEASLLGHYLYSTTHAGDAIRALRRLRYKGAAQEDLAAGLIGIVSMRLVRRGCLSCRIDDGPLTDAKALALIEQYLGADAAASAHSFSFPGCAICGHKGFSGRVGVFEFLEVNDDVADAILHDLSSREIAALDPDYQPLMVDALRRALDGETSFSEILGLARG